MFPEALIDTIGIICWASFIAWRWKAAPKAHASVVIGAIVFGIILVFVLLSFHAEIYSYYQRYNCTYSYFGTTACKPAKVNADVPIMIEGNTLP